ncbi:MAG TPA: hypothetical protein VMF65_25665 [Acidimicrobiales bacterium]|nr:hypothetical protein [Acidimicrobiales bacterium]
MALRRRTTDGPAKPPHPVTALMFALVAVLCLMVVAATLAAVAGPAAAATGAPTIGPPTIGSPPASLSGTISYAFSYSVPGPCPGCRTSESLSVRMAVVGNAVRAAAGSPGSYWDNPDAYRCALATAAGSNCFWAPLTVESASAHYTFAAHLDAGRGCHTNVSATGVYKAVSTPPPLGLDVVFNPGPAGSTSTGQPGPSPAPASGASGLPPAGSFRASGSVAILMSMTYTNRAAAATCGIKMPANRWDIPIGFVGPYRLGQTAVQGAATYEGLGPPRLAWDLTVKPTGLEITSPVAGSTIALTDGNYLLPQPGPDQSAPKSRYLIVKGVDTSPGATVVTVAHVPARIAADRTWSVHIPVSLTGRTTVTATDNAGAKAGEEITLIDLVVTSPAEDAVLAITTAPAMPRLGAVAGIEGYSGNVSPVVFNWSLSARGEYRDRCGHNPNALCGQWYPYDNDIASGTTTGTSAWQGNFTTIEGGFGRLSVSAIIPGVLDEPVRSEPRWIEIQGTNPSIAAIKAYVSSQDPANAPVEDKLFCHESAFTQFNPAPDPREPATTTVPHDISQNPPSWQPLFGAQFAGIGIAQRDPSSFPAQQWDWHDNVDAGIAVYQETLAGARTWRQAEQVRLSGQLTAVLKLVNHQRKAKKMKPLASAPRLVPALSAEEVKREAIRRYNGENEYHFNFQYVASRNHLSVVTVGTGKWVEDAGEWQSVAAWQAAGGALVARKWLPAQDPGYVQLVEACNL